MTSKSILVFLTMFMLTSCSTKSKKTYNSKLAIQSKLAELSDIALDTAKFAVLVDSIRNTEGAFDLDYTWYVSIRFDRAYFENVKMSIRSTSMFDSATNSFDNIWDGEDAREIKGIWYSDSTFLKFIQKPQQFNPEPIYISVDTIKKSLDLESIHL